MGKAKRCTPSFNSTLTGHATSLSPGRPVGGCVGSYADRFRSWRRPAGRHTGMKKGGELLCSLSELVTKLLLTYHLRIIPESGSASRELPKHSG
jgi:hypothetical protein